MVGQVTSDFLHHTHTGVQPHYTLPSPLFFPLISSHLISRCISPHLSKHFVSWGFVSHQATGSFSPLLVFHFAPTRLIPTSDKLNSTRSHLTPPDLISPRLQHSSRLDLLCNSSSPHLTSPHFSPHLALFPQVTSRTTSLPLTSPPLLTCYLLTPKHFSFPTPSHLHLVNFSFSFNLWAGFLSLPLMSFDSNIH